MGLDDGTTVPPEVAEASTTQSAAEQLPTKVITREIADAKEAEVGNAYSSLMDTLEESRAEQGDYYLPVRVGYDTDEFGGDNRVFVFRAGVQDPDDTRDALCFGISRNGIMTIRNTPGSGRDPLEGVEGAIARAASEGLTLRLLPNGQLGSDNQEGGINLKMTLDTETPTNRLNALVSSAIDRSIAAAEAPHKARHQGAQEKIDLAKSLSGKIGKLPPRE